MFHTQPLVHEGPVKTLCCNKREALGLFAAGVRSGRDPPFLSGVLHREKKSAS